MEVVERSAKLGEIGDDNGGRQTRVASLRHQPGKVWTIDPIHDQHIRVLGEEVVSNNGKTRVRA
jgi:hypothetical protein